MTSMLPFCSDVRPQRGTATVVIWFQSLSFTPKGHRTPSAAPASPPPARPPSGDRLALDLPVPGVSCTCSWRVRGLCHLASLAARDVLKAPPRGSVSFLFVAE